MSQKLPPELLQAVLEYASVIRRDGEYISRIAKTDSRYTILQTIPTKKIIYLDGTRAVHVSFSNRKGSITYYEPGSTKVRCFYTYYMSIHYRNCYCRRENPIHYHIDLNQKIDIYNYNY